MLVGALVLLAGCGEQPPVFTDDGGVAAVKQEIVYGADNRLDVYQHPNATLRARAEQSTVALMQPGMLNTSNPNNVTFNANTLGTSRNLCTTERFRSDPAAAFCSGTLIDDDLVLTAGHCVENASDCSNTRFVFNYYRPSASTLKTVTTADVFSCAQIVVHQLGVVSGQNLDYAIIRLDRSASPRFIPAPVRTANTALSVGQNVAVLGSGSGIPVKIDSGGAVRNARASTLDYFVANTDTFGGNSGSGVYETSGHTVAGILVRGGEDYVANGSCNVVNTCTESGCDGESITYVRPAIQAYCLAASSTRLCGTTPPPPPPPTNALVYTATNTNSAQQGFASRVLALQAGDTVKLGTCGLTNATFTGDTFLRLRGPAGTEVAQNDDACGGRGSQLTYVATAAGNYEIRGGCYSSGSCSGTAVWEVTPRVGGGSSSFSYSASNTNGAQMSTVNHDVALTAGQTIQLGTCTVSGAAGTGDTFLRLYLGGVQVTNNDDGTGCGTLSFLRHTATQSGTYQIRAGCYENGSCTGTVAYTIQ